MKQSLTERCNNLLKSLNIKIIICLGLTLVVFSHLFVSDDLIETLALKSSNSSISKLSETSFVNHNVKAGQWVKYNITKFDVQSDNKLLEFIAKTLAANTFQGSIPNLFQNSSSLTSVSDIEWINVNATKVNGDLITTITEIKPQNAEPFQLQPVVRHIPTDNISSLPFALPSDVKSGDRFTGEEAGQKPFSVIVNGTLQKSVGGHKIAVYEVVGKQDTSNTVAAFTTETSTLAYYDKETGRLLGYIDRIELRTIFGTININLGISAIDWSNLRQTDHIT